MVQAGWQAKTELLTTLIEDAERDAGDLDDDLADQLEKLVASTDGASIDLAKLND